MRKRSPRVALPTPSLETIESSFDAETELTPSPAGRSADEVRTALRAIEAQLNSVFVQRSEAVRVILLGVLARQNYMLIGSPGTAKTSVIDAFTRHVDCPKFKILMGKFTQPEHLVGVLDINAFKQGRYETVTAGMMPETPFPILDETLKTSDGCMNSLLGILGPEREFQGRRTEVIATGGATNWPEVDGLSKHVEALFDRFLLRCVVTPVNRDDKVMRRALYRAEKKVAEYQPNERLSLADLALASHACGAVEIADEVLDLLDSVVGRLTAPRKGTDGKMIPSELEISDRRATQLQAVLRAQAWLEGRTEVTVDDFTVLRHGLWAKRKDLEAVRSVLDTVDVQLVQEIVRRIGNTRSNAKSLASAGLGAAKLNEAIEEIRKTAYEVRSKLERPVLSEQGRAQIVTELVSLKKEYEELKGKATKIIGNSQKQAE